MDLSPADRLVVDGIVDQEMGSIPGVVLSIGGPRGRYDRTYGLGRKLGKIPLDFFDHFRIGSVTKLFTATAILIAIDRGYLALYDTLEQFVPGVANGSNITVGNLLMHTSGVYDYTKEPSVAVGMALFGNSDFDRDDALKIIRNHDAVFAPGARWEYSNSNYILLGLILEAVTGKSVGQVIYDDVITPLGLISTSFPTTSDIPVPNSHGYKSLSILTLDATKFNAPGYAGAAGAVISTADDMRRLAEALRDGNLLSPAARALRDTTFVPTTLGANVQYGLGLLKFGEWLGHDGAIMGFGAVVFYHLGTGATFVAMQNLFEVFGPLRVEAMFAKIAAALYPGTI